MQDRKQEMTWLRYGIKKIMLWRDRHKTLKQLNALNPHMLKDIGLERAQIEATVDQIGKEQTLRWKHQRQRDGDARAATSVKHNLNAGVGAGSDQNIAIKSGLYNRYSS